MSIFKFFCFILGIVCWIIIIYYALNYYKKDDILLELDFYKDDVSPVYCLPWELLPELHDSINKLLSIHNTNLPEGDLYYLHDKYPRMKMQFDDADKNILQIKGWPVTDNKVWGYKRRFSNVKKHSSHQLKNGKWKLNKFRETNKLVSANKINGQINITGLFYYPPGGYKEWHTNAKSLHVPNWRVYFIYLTDPNTESYFCYINPITGKFHRMRDKHMSFNIFYLNNNQERLLWHSVKCIKGGRLSFGLKISPHQIQGLVKRLKLNPFNAPRVLEKDRII